MTKPQEAPAITRLEFIGEEREFVRYAKEGCSFLISIQDEGRTIKVFEQKNGTSGVITDVQSRG